MTRLFADVVTGRSVFSTLQQVDDDIANFERKLKNQNQIKLLKDISII